MILVKDVMLREFPLVDKNETLEQAIRAMDKYELDRVVVVDKGLLAGIVTKRDIMKKLATLRTRNLVPGRLYVSSFMTPDPKTITEDEPLKKAMQIMAEHEIGGLPVVRGREVIGLVTRWESLHLLKDLTGVRTANLMTAIPVSLKPADKILHVRKVLEMYNVIFIPVLDEDGMPIGYVTVDEVADTLFTFHKIVPEKFRKERIEHLTVEDIMRLRPPIVSPEDPLPKIVELMMERRSKGVIVVKDDKAIGVITLLELVKYAALYA